MKPREPARKRPGPAPMPEEQRRSIQVNISFREDEIAIVDARRQAVGMDRAAWIRAVALANSEASAPLPAPRVPELNQQVWSELGHAGANLNQLARRVNAGDVTVEIEEALEVLRRFRRWLIRGDAP